MTWSGRYTGDSYYKRFFCPHFHIPAVFFQCHQKHHCPVRSHGRSCCAGPLSCARGFTDWPPPFWFRGQQIKASHDVSVRNPRACFTFPVLYFFDTRRFAGTRAPRTTGVTCTAVCVIDKLPICTCWLVKIFLWETVRMKWTCAIHFLLVCYL